MCCWRWRGRRESGALNRVAYRRPELQEPPPHSLIGNVNATLGEHLLDVTIGESEPGIEPDVVPDDRGREAVAFETERCHRQKLRQRRRCA